MEKLKGKVIYSQNYEEAKAIVSFLLQFDTWYGTFSSPVYYAIGRGVFEYMPSNCELITLEQAKELVKEPLTFPRVMEVSDDKKNWVIRVVIDYKDSVYISWKESQTIEEAKTEIFTTHWNYAKEIQQTTKLTIAEIEKRLGITNLEII